jgi:hypothetical protein
MRIYIVTGNFAGSLSIGDVTYVSSNFNIFVAKYSLSGVLQWVNKRLVEGLCFDHAVQMNGDICLTGSSVLRLHSVLLQFQHLL